MRLRETVAAVALLVTMVGAASANDARVLWAATRDAPGIEERAVDVALDGAGIAVAAGLVADGGGTSRFAVRAHDVSTGALVWEDLPALGEPSEAAAVDVRSGVAVVVGWRGALQESDLVVRAYDLRSGVLRWSELVDAGGRDRASDVAIGAGLAVVAGQLDGVPLVRAYDVRSGAVRWEDRGGGRGAVAIRGSVVLVGGGTTIRAYDLRSGTPLWSHVDAMEHVAAVALRPPYAVVAGLRRLGDDPEDPTDLLVRAHDLRTGRVVWTDAYDGGERDAATAVAVEGRVVVVAGSVRRQYDAPIVRAYDLVDGAVLWTDLPATADHDTRAFDVVIRAGTAVVAGSLLGSHGVLAYDARRGTPLWRHDDGMISGAPWAVAAVPGQARVLVAGGGTFLPDPGDDTDFAVRAYRLRGARSSSAPRFADRGDGTVLDRATGLVWEKKEPAGSGPRAVDATFTWCADVAPTDVACDDPARPPDGTAFTDFLPHLNGIALGGATDWRLPTAAELLSIELCEHGTGLGNGSCLDPVFGRVASDWYWSSTVIPHSGAVGIAEFDFGYRHNSGPARAFHVRAVRGTPREPTG